jgi:hypothetical protein
MTSTQRQQQDRALSTRHNRTAMAMKRGLMSMNLLYYACFMYLKHFRRCSYGGNVILKDPFGCSELIAPSRGWGITALIAARAINLVVLPTSVCRKHFKVDTTKGFKTPSQIIIIEKQELCNEEDVHT